MLFKVEVRERCDCFHPHRKRLNFLRRVYVPSDELPRYLNVAHITQPQDVIRLKFVSLQIWINRVAKLS